MPALSKALHENKNNDQERELMLYILQAMSYVKPGEKVEIVYKGVEKNKKRTGCNIV